MNGKVVVLSGATSGIGRSTAIYLVNKGFTVYGLSRSIGRDQGVVYIECDIANRDEVFNAVNQILLKEKHVDALVNNAGIGISGSIEKTGAMDMDVILDVNVKGMIHLVQALLPSLRSSKGRIINIGSVAGRFTIPFQTVYSMTKAAVEVLSEGLAMELKPFNIHVTCLLLGDVNTGFTRNRRKNENEHPLYQKRSARSLKKMELDERNGLQPSAVAREIHCLITARKPPLKRTLGARYKTYLLLKRFLPDAVTVSILRRLYG